MAQNIWDDSLRNSLDQTRLSTYLLKDKNHIDRIGGTDSSKKAKDLTPLAAACRGGHIKVVDLLLKNGANANAPCTHGRTALYHATHDCPNQNRLAIVKALIEAKANVNEVYVEYGKRTPLMNAIEEVGDQEVVRALVDADADPKAANEKGRTPEMMAKDRNMEQDLLKKFDRVLASVSTHIVDIAVGAVQLIVEYANSNFIKNVKKGMVSKLYGISGTKDKANPVTNVDIPTPKTASEFQHNISNFVRKSGLEGFFTGARSNFLERLAENAVKLVDDPETDLGNPENLKRLTRLSLYQPVIYCDDSDSMSFNNSGKKVPDNRYRDQRQLVSRIARIATRIVPDDLGVHLHFINDGGGRRVSAAEIDAAMAAVTPKGLTKIGTNLIKKILDPLVYSVISDPNKRFEHPLLICVITDGIPKPEPQDTLKKAIIECRAKIVAAGFDKASVKFCVSQIGTDDKAEKFLLDLGSDDMKDVLHCTTDKLDVKLAEMKNNERDLEVWLLEMLTNPIMERHLKT